MDCEIGADAFDGAFDAHALEIVCANTDEFAPGAVDANGRVIGQGREIRRQAGRLRVSVRIRCCEGRREGIRQLGAGGREGALQGRGRRRLCASTRARGRARGEARERVEEGRAALLGRLGGGINGKLGERDGGQRVAKLVVEVYNLRDAAGQGDVVGRRCVGRKIA